MDLLISDRWLRKHLITKATPTELAKYMSLCGPSFERTKQAPDGDYIYHIEVTTNRVDTASVIGIAREASAILPRFGIKAKLKNEKLKSDNRFVFKKKVNYLNVKVNPKLCQRFTAALIKNVKISESPKEVKGLLENSGIRSINNVVDVSNYIMRETGQPVHTFDYDKIVNSTMILRGSKKGESITTLDGKNFILQDLDIVIEDGSKRLIDLCGIMGGQNSAVDINTKNVLLFVQNYNQDYIRKTSMTLNQRTEAAVLFEKGLDSENVAPSIIKAINMLEKLTGGKAEKEILDIYPNPYKEKIIITNKKDLDKIIGVDISKVEISSYLNNLGFKVNWPNDKLKISVPSARAKDIEIKEDIAEEIARIYGYHNLPCVLMEGKIDISTSSLQKSFKIESLIRQVLKEVGGNEIYTISLVKKESASSNALKLTNPLGSDQSYLRTSLRPSLMESIDLNLQEKGYIHLFEISNIYLPRNNDLPEERLMLAGIIKSGNYRENKGVVETLLDELNISYESFIDDGQGYLPNQRNLIRSGKLIVGEYGNLDNNMFYYEFSIDKIIQSNKKIIKYHDISKYPPQVEDLTLTIPEKTYIGQVIQSIESASNLVISTQLKDIYQQNYTFSIVYQDPNKTLTDEEVEKIRNKILSTLKSKFGIISS